MVFYRLNKNQKLWIYKLLENFASQVCPGSWNIIAKYSTSTINRCFLKTVLFLKLLVALV